MTAALQTSSARKPNDATPFAARLRRLPSVAERTWGRFVSSGTRQRCQRVSTLSAPMLGLHVAPTEKSRRPAALTPADSADGFASSEASPAVRCQRCHLRAQEHQGFLPPPPSNFSPTPFRRNPLTPLTPSPPGRFPAAGIPVPAPASSRPDGVRPTHGRTQ
jgi:hypothetical protein